jgi:hypothetical protein
VTVPPDRITLERLARWRRMLDKAQATPVLVLGIGHAADSEVHVLVPDDVDTLTVIGLLQLAIKQLASTVPLRTDQTTGEPSHDQR